MQPFMLACVSVRTLPGAASPVAIHKYSVLQENQPLLTLLLLVLRLCSRAQGRCLQHCHKLIQQDVYAAGVACSCGIVQTGPA